MEKLLALVLVLTMCLTLLPLVSMAEDGFRYDEPITLKISVFDRGVTGGTAVDNNAWTKWIQENFGDPRNIKIEWVVIPRSEEESKLNILMASGEAADISFTYNEALVTNFVAQGGLVELSDLIEKYGPHLKSFLGETVLSAGIFNGGQYAIPARRVVVATQGMFIREDWLDELGLAMPTTREEFYNDLVAFKNARPDCIPYAMGSDLRGHSPLMYSFIKDMDARTLACKAQPTWDGYEDYVLFLNKLYNEGLISPDFALDTSDLLYGDITSGKAGGYTYNYDHPIRVSPGLLASLRAYEPEAKLSALNCFESVTDSTKYYHESYSPAGLQCFVPIYSKHPEAAVMYMDWLCEYETIYFLQNGIEGLTYDLNEDGIPVVKDVEGEYHFNSMQNIDYTLPLNGQYLDQEELLIKAQATSYQGFADLFEDMYNVGNTDLILGVNVHFDRVLEANSQYNTALTAFHKEILTKAVMASPDDCAKLWESLVEEYMNMGGKAVEEEKFAAWDAMHEAQ